jgi:hypothetical protein
VYCRVVGSLLAVVVCAVIVSTTSCAREGGSNDGLQPVSVDPHDVVAIQQYIVPEGTQPPPFVNHPRTSRGELPLAEIVGFLPEPLPAASRVATCGGFTALTIVLRDGRELAYGACDYPADFGSFPTAVDAAYENHGVSV